MSDQQPWYVRFADWMADNGARMVGDVPPSKRTRPSDELNFTGGPARVELLNLIYDATASKTPPNWWSAELMPAIWRYEREIAAGTPPSSSTTRSQQ